MPDISAPGGPGPHRAPRADISAHGPSRNTFDSCEPVAGKLGSQTRWERMIIRPTSGPRLAWGVVALFLMAYEGWLVPLTFFSIRDHSLDMAVRIFWTCDLLLQATVVTATRCE